MGHFSVFITGGLFAFLGVLLVACGGGDGQGATPATQGPPVAQPPPAAPPPPRTPNTVSGQFKDSNVAGLSFQSGAQQGTTDTVGSFTCEEGGSVSFAIGAVTLGSTLCDRIVTPLDLVSGSTLDSPQVLNRVRFLLLLDGDGDATNGIVIPDEVRALANDWAPVDFAATNFGAEVSDVVDSLRNSGKPARLPDESVARSHLLRTVACTHSGAYWLYLYVADNASIAGVLAIYPVEVDGVSMVGWGWQHATTDNNVLEFSAPASSVAFGDSTGIEFSDPAVARFAAQFVSSDHLVGQWSRGSGKLTGDRATGTGNSYATHRFVGYAEDPSCCGSAFTFELFDDGRVIATESWLSAWDFPADVEYAGVVEGNRLLLSTQSDDFKIAGTIDLLADPPTIRFDTDPERMQGVIAYGCKLN